MEYMAAGLPVIVTDGGGSREIVLDGETGFLIPGSNPERLAEKIVVLLDDPNRARRMGHAGKVRLTSHFSLDRLSVNTLRMYQEVLAGDVDPNNLPEQRALGRGIGSSHEVEFDHARHPNSSNRMPLRILVVTAMYPHPGQEGSGAFVMQQVEQLRAFGHEVDVLHFPGYRSKLEYLRAAREVRRRTRRERYDVVHAHYGVTGIAAIFRRRTPLVVTLHGSDALLGRLGPMISRWVCQLADATIVASRKIAARIPGEIIPCGVDLSRFEPKGREASRERLGLAQGRRYVLFPFNPARRVKRFDLAATAVDRLTAGGLDVELLTVSKVPNEEMPWYYSAADAMILCSDSEGSPTAVKEALACNLPVVSTDVGDVTEILEGIDGCAVRPQSAEGLAEGLQRVLFPTSGLVFDGRQAMRRYCQEETVRKIVQVYYRTIERREPRAASASAHSTVPAVAKGEVRSEK